MWKADQPDLQSANMGPKGPQSDKSGGGERARVLSRLRADIMTGERSREPVGGQIFRRN